MLRFIEGSSSPAHVLRPVADGARVALPSRCRLIERLIEETAGSAGMQRLTLVCAPTGYGKSATIADWIGDDSDGAWPVRWLHCAKGTAEQFWQAVEATLTPLSDTPATPDTPNTPATDRSDPIAGSVQLALGLRDGVTLVLDDYHLVTSAATDMALARLSADSPRLTIIVIARRVSLLDGPLVSATTRVRLIGADDLRLTPPEALELAQSLGIPPSPLVTAALERSDGWPLAIRAALNLGSDTLYSDTPQGRVWAGGQVGRAFDPLSNLNAFAMGSLEILSDAARTVVLAATQIDSLSLGQVRKLIERDEPTVQATLQHLCELGFLVPMPGIGGPEYRCHRAVRTPFADHAADVMDISARKDIYRTRAEELIDTAPFTAFRLLCAAEAFVMAEAVLALNFTTITDEVDGSTKVLRALPEHTLLAHPTLTAALLFLEMPVVGAAPTRLKHLLRLWQGGLHRRLPAGIETTPGPIHLQLLCQAMVMNRVLGDLDSARALMLHIEARLSPGHYPAAPLAAAQCEDVPVGPASNGSLPVFYREVASTALAVGEFERARRNLKRLRRHSERKIAAPWHGFAHASTRTVTDAESGANWRIAALSELAFTDVIDGHIRRAGELLTEIDAEAALSGARAPGISWVGAEIARAHLAQESGDTRQLTQVSDTLSLISDRLEPWPMLLIAESAALRRTRGTELALANLVSGVNDGKRLAPIPKAWHHYVVNFEAMLNSTIGNLTRAGEIIDSGPPDDPAYLLERARLAVFSGDDVKALLLAQGVGDPGLTKRQRVDRRLLTAVAAWGCGRTTEAIAAIAAATELVQKYFLPAMLISVPFEQLRGVAVAAREVGACDIVEAIDTIPEHARAHRYEQLTEMELRTLGAIAAHRNASLAAESLFVTAGTVKKHLASVYRKLGVRDRDAAILRAGRMGLLPGSQPPAG